MGKCGQWDGHKYITDRIGFEVISCRYQAMVGLEAGWGGGGAEKTQRI